MLPQKKTFIELRKIRSLQSVFTDDDLDVPKEGLFKKNRRATRTSGSYTIVQVGKNQQTNQFP